MDSNIEDGDCGGLGRDNIDLERETNFKFQWRWLSKTLWKVQENEFPERDSRDFGLLLYDGVISDEEFVLLYNEIKFRCYLKVNVRCFIEPICDLRIATFPHAPQFFV